MKAPKSGRLFQESLYRRPFWMLVACQLVNQTTWEQAKPALKHLMKTYDIQGLADADPRWLHKPLRPLGLWRRRSELIIKMAEAWVLDRPPRLSLWSAENIKLLPGCGQYAADSWSIFMDGQRPKNVKDGKLKWYLKRQRSAGRQRT